MRLAALSIFILIASGTKSLKLVGGADESAGLAAGGMETILATQEQKGATDCDYKGCQEQRLAIEDVRDYEANCAVDHQVVGHNIPCKCA